MRRRDGRSKWNPLYPGMQRISCLLALVALWFPLLAHAWKWESASVTLPAVSAGSTSFVTVNFRQTYPAAPLVFVLAAANYPGDQPSSVRIRAVTASGFQIAQAVAPTTQSGRPTYPLPAVEVHYIAIEPGDHRLPDGTRVVAGSISSNVVANAWANISFPGGFGSAPAMLGQIMTMNNESGAPPGAVSRPWMSAVVRNVTPTTAQIAIDRAQVTLGTVSANEQLAYLAIDSSRSGNFNDNASASVSYRAIRSANNVQGWQNSCTSVPFSPVFTATPLVVGTRNTRNGGDGGWLRRCNLNNNLVGVTVDEDQYADAERSHASEIVGVLAFSRAFDADIPPPPVVTPDTRWKMEAGRATVAATAAGSTTYTNVSFAQTFDVVPVVIALSGAENPEPAAVRIRNISTTGFQLAPVEPLGEDGAQPAGEVHYFAIEPGVHQMPDGRIIEALTLSTNRVQSKQLAAAATGWESVIYGNPFAASPSVAAFVQTMNNEAGAVPGAPSNPWLGAVIAAGSANGFNVALERAETVSPAGAAPVSANESIGYVAMSAGITGTFPDSSGNPVVYETQLPTITNSWGTTGACSTFGLLGSYTAPPLVVGSHNSRNGTDGTWVRRCSVTNTQYRVTIDEDQATDSDRAHISELASFFIFSRPFSTDMALLAWWGMDEINWNGAAPQVADISGNGRHASRTAASVNTAPARVCRGGDFPVNTSTSTFEAVDTGINPATDIGAQGTISFWYRPDNAWNTDDAMLLDASRDNGNNAADKFFFLEKESNGRLRFRLEDSADAASEVRSPGNLNLAAGFHHIAITWDLGASRLQIYLDGALHETSTSTLNGSFGSLNTLYIGDNRTSGVGGNAYHGESARGVIDEVRVYRGVRTQAQIQADMNATRPCGGADHFAIVHDGNAINCQGETVTIRAHDSSDAVFTAYTGTINLSTSTGHGDWSLITGVAGNLSNSGGGLATYTFTGSEAGEVVLSLRNTFAETLNINVSEGGLNESPSEDPDLDFTRSGFNFLADGTMDAIGTQIAGKPSDVAPGAQTLELQAIRTSDDTGACEAALVGNNTIELAFECEDPGSCSSRQVGINGAAIAGNPSGSITSYTPVPLDFGDATDSTATFVMDYPDAGRIRLHARLIQTPAGDDLTGSSNDFVVRPFAFDISVPGNPGGAGPTDTIFTTASTDFTTQVRAVLWEAADDTNNDGIADGHNDSIATNNANLANNAAAISFGREVTAAGAVLSASLQRPAAGTHPGLAGTLSVGGFSNGQASVTSRYDEVGSIEIEAAVSGGDYLGIGAAETARISGRSGFIGRFRPAAFNVSVNSPTFDAACNGAFTFLGQALNYAASPAVNINARNALGDPTRNYYDFGAGENWWKLPDIVPAYADMGMSAGVTIDTALAGHGPATSLPSAPGEVDTVFNGPLAYTRPAGDTLPFNSSMRVSFAVQDADGVAYDDGAGGNVFSFAVGFTAGHSAEQRHGRIMLQNAYGSELLPLGIPMFTEHFVAAGYFQKATDDACTNAALADLDLANDVDDPAAGDPAIQIGAATSTGTITNSPFVAGEAGLSFSAPGAGNTGYVDIALDAGGLPWLQYDWDNDGVHDDNPGVARGVFGVYSNPDVIIFRREMY